MLGFMRPFSLIALGVFACACPPQGAPDGGSGGGSAGGRAGGAGGSGGGAGGQAGGATAGGQGGGAVFTCTDFDAGVTFDAGVDAGPPPRPAPYDGGYAQFCARISTLACDQDIACGRFASAERADCVSLNLNDLCGLTVDEVSRGMLLFDRVAAAQCLSGYDGGCGGGTCPGYLIAGGDAGASCLLARDCTGQSACTGPSCMRTCEPAGAVGQACLSGDGCDQGAWCNRSTGRCLAPQPVGSTCTFDSLTNPECDPVTGFCQLTAGRCAALPVAGQPCAASQRCAAGHWCDTAASPGSCRTFVMAGQPCTNTTACGPDRFCNTALNPDACADRRDAGVMCTLSAQCQMGLVCSRGACTTPKREGEACRSDSECPGFGCDDVLRTCRRVSTALPFGACSGDRVLCPPDHACTGAAIDPSGGPGCTGACLPERIGDRCTTHSRCPLRAFCDDGGVCQAAAGANPCANGEQCAVDRYCLPSTRTCVPRPQRGEPCTASTVCASPWNCRGATADAGGICESPGELDAGCSTFFDCQLPYECAGGHCVRSGHATEACYYGFLCFDGACGDAGTCGAPRGDGATCRGCYECASGYCDGRTCSARCP